MLIAKLAYRILYNFDYITLIISSHGALNEDVPKAPLPPDEMIMAELPALTPEELVAQFGTFDPM